MTTPEEKDPLASLLGENAAEINRLKLATFLKPLVTFGKDKSMTFLPAFNALSATKKVEVMLSAAKARGLLFEGEPDGLLPSELLALDVMPAGTAKPTIKKLYDGRRIRKDKDGRYFIPLFILDELVAKGADSGSKERPSSHD